MHTTLAFHSKRGRVIVQVCFYIKKKSPLTHKYRMKMTPKSMRWVGVSTWDDGQIETGTMDEWVGLVMSGDVKTPACSQLIN